MTIPQSHLASSPSPSSSTSSSSSHSPSSPETPQPLLLARNRNHTATRNNAISSMSFYVMAVLLCSYSVLLVSAGSVSPPSVTTTLAVHTVTTTFINSTCI